MAGRYTRPMTPVQRRVLIAAILASGIVFIDATIVNIALERIGRELPTRRLGILEGQTYVVAGYLATLASLLVLGGALGDRYGRRRVFLVGLVGFGIASAACAAAPTMEALTVARVLQGVAGALLVPGSIAAITATFAPAPRARAFGIWASATALVNLLGPVVGGVLVTALSWRVAFVVNLPIVVVAAWLAVRWMPESRDEDAAERFDLLGAAVGVAAVGGLVFGAIRGQQRQWADPWAFAALGVGLVATLAFPFLMARRPHALIPISLFRDRRFAAVNLATFCVYGALNALLFFVSLFLQGILGYSPLGAGFAITIMAVALVTLSTRVGTLAGRLGPRRFLTVGPFLMAAGCAWWLLVPAGSPAWRPDGSAGSLLPPLEAVVGPGVAMLLVGVGISFVAAPITTALMASVPVGRAGVASALNNAISRVGQPLISAAVFVLVTGRFYAELASRVPGLDAASAELRAAVQPLNVPTAGTDPLVAAAALDASTDVFRLVMAVCAALCAVGGIVSWYGLAERSAKQVGDGGT